jgi:type IV pilus assembly protein PilE
VRHAKLAAAKVIPVRGRLRRQRTRIPGTGFTLLELLIVVLLMSVLLALAIPSYRQYVQRTQRAEATRALLTAAACQERIRARTGTYDTSRCLEDALGDRYTLRIEPQGVTTATEFTLIAEPLPGRGADRCGALSLDQSGTRGIAGEPSALAGCWSGR